MDSREHPDRPGDPSGEGAAWHEPTQFGQGGSTPDEALPLVPDQPHAAGGAQAWALQHGWTFSDGTGPADAPLRTLLDGGPLRLGREHRPARVIRGRWGSLELVAFDVVFPMPRRGAPDAAVTEYAVTAAPLLAPVPRLRLSPARLWKHGTSGLLPLPSGDPEFDLRWTLLSTEDAPPARRLAQDPTVRGLLLGSDDGDEFWTAAGHVAVVRPDGHRPLLLEHHARLLTAVVGGLSAGF